MQSPVKVTERFKLFVEGFRTHGEAARYLKIKRPLLVMYLHGHPVSATFISRMVGDLGWKYKDAFTSESS